MDLTLTKSNKTRMTQITESEWYECQWHIYNLFLYLFN